MEQKVNPDVYHATLYKISCSDEMEFETAYDGNIRISFASLTILLSSCLVRNMQCSQEVSGRQVRYATMQPQHVKASHSTVWLSVWTPDCRSIENVYIRMEDLSTAIQLLNALRRLRFIADSRNTICLETFHPRVAAFYDVCVELKSGTNETAPFFQPKFCVVDEEAFAVYDDVVAVSPMIMMRFQCERGDDVIEFMYMDTKTNTVKIVNDRLEVKVQRLLGAQREQGGRTDDHQTPHADQEAQDDHGTQPQDEDQPVQETEPDIYMTTVDFEKTVSHGQMTVDDQVAALQQVAAPANQMAAPVDEMEVTVDPMEAPVGQVAAPVDQVAAPIDQVAAPVDQVVAPVDQVAAPVDQVAAPVDQVVAPVDQVAAPVDQVAAPVDQVAAPIDQVAASVDQVAAPVDQVAAPVDQVAAPVDQVAAPVDQVAAPVDQVAAPVDQLDDDQRVRYETRTPVVSLNLYFKKTSECAHILSVSNT